MDVCIQMDAAWIYKVKTQLPIESFHESFSQGVQKTRVRKSVSQKVFSGLSRFSSVICPCLTNLRG